MVRNLLLVFIVINLSACTLYDANPRRVEAITISSNQQPLVTASYERALAYEGGEKNKWGMADSFDKSLETQPKISAKSLVSLFRQARSHNKYEQIFLSDIVTAYFKSCCESKEAAITQLENSGFTIKLIELNESNRHQYFDNPEEDFIIAASRKGKMRYWFKDEWRISLYLKNGKIQRAFSKIVTQ